MNFSTKFINDMVDLKKYAYLFCLLMLLSQLHAAAQSKPRISVDLSTNTITINDVKFDENSTIDDYEAHLGRADRILQKRGIDQFFAYDKLGFTLSINKETEVVNEIFISYAPDSDGKVAREVYTGQLSVNNRPINPQTSYKELGRHIKIEFIEILNGYFVTPNRPLNLLLQYPQDVKPYTTLKQFGLRFSSSN